MKAYSQVLLKLFMVYYMTKEVMSALEFTNIICESLDKEFCDFELCHLKSVNRSYKYATLKLNLFKVPITNVTVNVAFYKRLNGYKPFLYNVTTDGCKFLKNPKSSPVTKFIYGFVKDVSNINHSCPYDHDILVEKLTANILHYHLTKVLPFPDGNYMLQCHLLSAGIKRVTVKVYISLVS